MKAIYDRHRGPFVLCIIRRNAASKTGFDTEWTKKPLKAAEADEEARMLAGDPRDAVESVHVYSLTENCYIGALYGRSATVAPWDKTTSNVPADAPAEDDDMNKKASKAAKKAATATAEPKAPRVTKKAVTEAVKEAVAQGSRASHPYFATRKELPATIGGQKRLVYATVAAAGDAGLQKAALLVAVKDAEGFKGKDQKTVTNNVSFYLSKLKAEGFLKVGRDAEPIGGEA